jgi:CRISPR-associated exonuclease Cas4
MHAFRDIETAAYCARKLYHRRRDAAVEVPDVSHVRDLAFEYDHLLDVDAALLAAPIEVSPGTFRERLRAARDALDAWGQLVDPPSRAVFLTGKDCRGSARTPSTPPTA